MRKPLLLYIISSLVFSLDLFGQSNVEASNIPFYNDWGWEEVLVTRNEFVSIAVVPEAGGRILEHKLANVPSLWINPNLIGKSFKPNDEVKKEEWRNFGGYRLVPLPFDNCSIDRNGERTKRWPPPAILGDSPYSANIGRNKEGIKTIEVVSGIQELPVPNFDYKTNSFIYPEKIEESLQYKRSLYIKPGSSLVFIQHNLINKGELDIKRGIMTSSQHISQTKPGVKDGENYVAYIPFDPKYKLANGHQYEITTTADSRWRYVNNNRKELDKNNPEHLKRYYNHGTNWTGEVAPGIFEMHYDYDLMSGFHIISSKSWICYVNKVNNTAFAKILEPYNPELNYVEGINVSVFCSGLESGYLETEVRTPIYTLKPNEGFKYLEIIGAARITANPVLDVNQTGIITKRINLEESSNEIVGEFGVFHKGSAVLKFKDNDRNIIKEAVVGEVSPLRVFSLAFSLENKAINYHDIELVIRDETKTDHLLDIFLRK